MTTGLNTKVVTYNAENRPLLVTATQVRTCCVYGASGARVKKIEGLTVLDDCADLQGAGDVTAYFGGVEIRDFGGTETILTYPHPSVRLEYKNTDPVKITYLHRDQLNSVRMTTLSAALIGKRTSYRPFGEVTEHVVTVPTTPETKGFIPLSGICKRKSLPRQRGRGSTPTQACNTSTPDTTTQSSGGSFSQTGLR